ncbi:MAG: hypothetical protein J7619_11965 [Dyadobacter sp.]|uniref:hypothetical protein n=1 Tax=Dyadobacter sp. TaxID=1914288 RepID=UPI001B046CDA|nr:hypothetical protein [Dyadobacter sp.]MBO9613408.1 hypothetical protein [Dyadobacter sp.]
MPETKIPSISHEEFGAMITDLRQLCEPRDAETLQILATNFFSKYRASDLLYMVSQYEKSQYPVSEEFWPLSSGEPVANENVRGFMLPPSRETDRSKWTMGKIGNWGQDGSDKGIDLNFEGAK